MLINHACAFYLLNYDTLTQSTLSFSLQAGPTRGGAGGTMTPGPWSLGGPWALSWGPLASGDPAEGPWASEGPSK